MATKKMGFTFPFYKWLDNISISAPTGKQVEMENKFKKKNCIGVNIGLLF